jgi:hypothetical protein
MSMVSAHSIFHCKKATKQSLARLSELKIFTFFWRLRFSLSALVGMLPLAVHIEPPSNPRVEGWLRALAHGGHRELD